MNIIQIVGFSVVDGLGTATNNYIGPAFLKGGILHYMKVDGALVPAEKDQFIKRDSK